MPCYDQRTILSKLKHYQHKYRKKKIILLVNRINVVVGQLQRTSTRMNVFFNAVPRRISIRSRVQFSCTQSHTLISLSRSLVLLTTSSVDIRMTSSPRDSCTKQQASAWATWMDGSKMYLSMMTNLNRHKQWKRRIWAFSILIERGFLSGPKLHDITRSSTPNTTWNKDAFSLLSSGELRFGGRRNEG